MSYSVIDGLVLGILPGQILVENYDFSYLIVLNTTVADSVCMHMCIYIYAYSHSLQSRHVTTALAELTSLTDWRMDELPQHIYVVYAVAIHPSCLYDVRKKEPVDYRIADY